MYLEKRDIPNEYNPIGSYDFETWKNKLTNDIKANYENLHNILLYTNERQETNKTTISDKTGIRNIPVFFFFCLKSPSM
jgi:hypothetical protein